MAEPARRRTQILSPLAVVLSGGPYTVWSHFAGGVDVFQTCAIPSAVCASSQRNTLDGPAVVRISNATSRSPRVARRTII